jgi:predicted P-loop ATPase
MYASIAHYPEAVQEFLKSDRQWPRRLRVKHATQRLFGAATEAERLFWQTVLSANATKEHQ